MRCVADQKLNLFRLVDTRMLLIGIILFMLYFVCITLGKSLYQYLLWLLEKLLNHFFLLLPLVCSSYLGFIFAVETSNVKNLFLFELYCKIIFTTFKLFLFCNPDVGRVFLHVCTCLNILITLNYSHLRSGVVIKPYSCILKRYRQLEFCFCYRATDIFSRTCAIKEQKWFIGS